MTKSKPSASRTPIITVAIIIIVGVIVVAALVVTQSQPRQSGPQAGAPAVVQVPTLTGARTPAEICQASVPATTSATHSYSRAEQVTPSGVDYRAIFCTDVGPVYVDLLEHNAPIAVNNFIFLSINGYYNNTTFHRVIQDFMAQGGDPTGTGRGNPGYSFGLENADNLLFDQPGRLAMANTGQPNSNGGQFFITTVPYPSLNNGYTIFGNVVEGQDVVGKIKLRDPDTATTPGTSLQTVVIVSDPATVKTG